jgi:hypothetical protein
LSDTIATDKKVTASQAAGQLLGKCRPSQRTAGNQKQMLLVYPIEGRAQLHHTHRDSLINTLSRWEDDWGTGTVHRVIEAWWRLHYPPGRVVWQKEHGS